MLCLVSSSSPIKKKKIMIIFKSEENYLAALGVYRFQTFPHTLYPGSVRACFQSAVNLCLTLSYCDVLH